MEAARAQAGQAANPRPRGDRRRGDAGLAAETQEIERRASAAPPVGRKVADALGDEPKTPPAEMVRRFDEVDFENPKDRRADDVASELVGSHGQNLIIDLDKVAEHWRMARAAGPSDCESVTDHATTALGALVEAQKHALLLTALRRLTKRHLAVGKRYDIDANCRNWGVDQAGIDALWEWAKVDVANTEFCGKQVPVAVDEEKRRLYRTAGGAWQRLYTVTAVAWGAALFFGLVVGAFVATKQVGAGKLADGWLAHMAVLYGCVVLGAWAHLAFRGLSAVDYDEGLKIQDASGRREWLSLRWVSVLWTYVPVAVVAGLMWATGTFPTTGAVPFEKLAAAVVAGFAADSTLRNILLAVRNRKKQTGAEQAKAGEAGKFSGVLAEVEGEVGEAAQAAGGKPGAEAGKTAVPAGAGTAATPVPAADPPDAAVPATGAARKPEKKRKPPPRSRSRQREPERPSRGGSRQ